MSRFVDITSDNLRVAHIALAGINKDLVKIMKKLGHESRSFYVHSDVTNMGDVILRELGERTFDEAQP